MVGMGKKNAKGKNSKGKKDEEDGLHRVKMRVWIFKMMCTVDRKLQPV